MGRLSRSGLSLGLVAVVLAGGGAYAIASSSSGTITVCVSHKGGTLYKSKTCARHDTKLSWNKSDPTADAFVGRFGASTGNAAAANGATCTLGQVLLSASPTVTAGGVPADGQLLSISQYTALFSLLGTTYGGNGTSTFALPDLRALAPNDMTYSICDTGVYPARR